MTRTTEDYNRHELERARKESDRADFMAGLLLVSICAGAVLGYLICKFWG